jgi:hypothetical protein
METSAKPSVVPPWITSPALVCRASMPIRTRQIVPLSRRSSSGPMKTAL